MKQPRLSKWAIPALMGLLLVATPTTTPTTALAASSSGVVQFWQVIPEGQEKPSDMTESELRNLLYCKVNHDLKTGTGTLGKQNTYINSCYVDDGYYLGETDSSYRVLVSGYEGYVSKESSTTVSLSFYVDVNGKRVSTSSAGSYKTYQFKVLTTAEFVPFATETGGLSVQSDEPVETLEFDEYLKTPEDLDLHLANTYLRTATSSVALSPSYYAASNGDLYHYISKDVTRDNYYGKIMIGKAPEFMKAGVRYYSYDGVYFYTNASDINVSGQGAVNESDPFYNYYQYLPIRSLSTLSATQINDYMKAAGYTQKPTSTSTSDLKSYQSVMSGEGDTFKEIETTYSVNGALQFAMGIHESAFGRSSISVAKNNLFGINAVDLNPSGQADSFESAAASIRYHAERYLSWGYSDPLTDSRYYGFYLGNKAGGMNVSYASDPFWGEKISAHYYQLDKANGLSDYNQVTIGMVTGNQKASVYAKPSTSSSVLYQTWNAKTQKTVAHYPVQIVGESGDFYIIKPDTPINAQGVAQYNGPYDYENTVGYILKSAVSYVSQSVPSVDEPSVPSPDVPEEVLPVLKTQYVEPDLLNVRSTPSTSGALLGQLKKGAEVSVLKESDGWTLITYGEGTAWVFSSYLVDEAPSVDVPTETPTPEEPTVESDIEWNLPALTVEAGTDVDWLAGVSAYDENKESLAIQVAQNGVNLNRPGQYEITYQVDSRRETLLQVRAVTVVDTTAPTISLTGAISQSHELGETYQELGYETSDNAEGEVRVTVSMPVGGFKKVGSYDIIYTAYDAAGNQSKAVRTLKVQDTIAPQLTLKGASTLKLKTSEVYVEPGYEANDASSSVEVIITSSLPTPLVAGTYELVYLAKDESGNQSRLTRTVVVTSDSLADEESTPEVETPIPPIETPETETEPDTEPETETTPPGSTEEDLTPGESENEESTEKPNEDTTNGNQTSTPEASGGDSSQTEIKDETESNNSSNTNSNSGGTHNPGTPPTENTTATNPSDLSGSSAEIESNESTGGLDDFEVTIGGVSEQSVLTDKEAGCKLTMSDDADCTTTVETASRFKVSNLIFGVMLSAGVALIGFVIFAQLRFKSQVEAETLVDEDEDALSENEETTEEDLDK